MKWMLVIIVFGTYPVKTDLVFDSLDKCLEAEEVMHAEQESKFQRWRQQFRRRAFRAGRARGFQRRYVC